MEEVGAQLAPPVVIHPTLPRRFCEGRSMVRKRDLCSNLHQQRSQNTTAIWSPKAWAWDSVGFVAKPLEPETLRLGTAEFAALSNQETKQGDSALNMVPDDGVEDERLRLTLGDDPSPSKQPVSRPAKRVRSGSPGGHSYSMCQVDSCREDLSNSKDYHRRHKVCELHSKSTEALVANQMQRFCQQCSRFHPLSEFDEGKRSCRRRLAGHNRRRRKSQPEDVAWRLSQPEKQDNSGSENLNVAELLAAFAHTQGSAKFASMPDKEQLVHILGTIKSLPLTTEFMTKIPELRNLDQKNSKQVFPDQQSRLKGSTPSSTVDLLPVSSSMPALPAADSFAVVSQTSQSSGSENDKLNCMSLNLQERCTRDYCSADRKRSESTSQHFIHDSDCQVQGFQGNLPLQLFSSSLEDGSPPKLAFESKYLSSDISNPMDDMSPSSSPVARPFFPMQTLKGATDQRKISVSNGADENIEACQMPLQPFRKPQRRLDGPPFQNHTHDAEHTPSTRSDYSPSCLNSDGQDRTGRIIFKLFDKDPSHLPRPLRAQIYKWLSNSPSEMESYIRPGCVILSLYLSMPPPVWGQLEDNLSKHVNCLVQDPDSDIWGSGRFLIHTGRQLASHKNGKIHLCKCWRSLKTPELISVSPLAIVGGQETTLLLRGRNLNRPGTKIHCAYMGGYVSKEVSELLAYQGSSSDEIHFGSFKIQDSATRAALGRCFIEVENGFRGNSFPLIIADASICQELRLLESVFDEEAATSDVDLEGGDGFGFGRQRPRRSEEMLHFLNELGWLFQRREIYGPGCLLRRLRFLVTFSVEKDCCALLKMLLDMLVERIFGEDGASEELPETMSGILLLNRAVKRQSRRMVNLLINYSVRCSNGATRKYLFPPNCAGPDGVTPLHLVAAMPGLDDVVDILTSDPQEIGMQCWDCALDGRGLPPCAYAVMRNNESYNRLVAQKLAHRWSGHLSVAIGNDSKPKLNSSSCAKCAAMLGNHINVRVSGAGGLLVQGPNIHCIVAVAAICACVCMFFRSMKHAFFLENMGHCPF